MARRSNEQASVVDKAKVRVFFAEVDGNNESVQEALKTMLSAMNRPVRVISEQTANGSAAVLLQHVDGEAVDEAMGQAKEIETLGDESTPPVARRPRGSGKKSDRNAGLALVPDLNFRPDGKPSLREFMEEKSPKNDLEAALVAIHYMQFLMKVDRIGPNHLMTALKEAGREIPKDVKQTIRNVRKSKMWLNFIDIENVRATTQGQNFVEHEMRKGE